MQAAKHLDRFHDRTWVSIQDIVKLRIRNNSIRLRLTKTEVDTLRHEGLVSACTRFPDGREFRHEVESSPASVTPDAFLSDKGLTVRLPETGVLAWATTEQVSIRGEQPLVEGEKLAILIEKDFACLAPREGEDESDMYLHPQSESGEGRG